MLLFEHEKAHWVFCFHIIKSVVLDPIDFHCGDKHILQNIIFRQFVMFGLSSMPLS